jgi:hypothetical protein
MPLIISAARRARHAAQRQKIETKLRLRAAIAERRRLRVEADVLARLEGERAFLESRRAEHLRERQVLRLPQNLPPEPFTVSIGRPN